MLSERLAMADFARTASGATPAYNVIKYAWPSRLSDFFMPSHSDYYHGLQKQDLVWGYAQMDSDGIAQFCEGLARPGVLGFIVWSMPAMAAVYNYLAKAYGAALQPAGKYDTWKYGTLNRCQIDGRQYLFTCMPHPRLRFKSWPAPGFFEGISAKCYSHFVRALWDEVKQTEKKAGDEDVQQ